MLHLEIDATSGTAVASLVNRQVEPDENLVFLRALRFWRL